eukprot:GHVU01040000.1.p1 GENE.GHVU01040000.1~~GHVU01040000.1.p1  ORF type:complete len:203 (+),score=0.04 GHVU01040000.1:225-833(+)
MAMAHGWDMGFSTLSKIFKRPKTRAPLEALSAASFAPKAPQKAWRAARPCDARRRMCPLESLSHESRDKPLRKSPVSLLPITSSTSRHILGFISPVNYYDILVIFVLPLTGANTHRASTPAAHSHFDDGCKSASESASQARGTPLSVRGAYFICCLSHLAKRLRRLCASSSTELAAAQDWSRLQAHSWNYRALGMYREDYQI